MSNRSLAAVMVLYRVVGEEKQILLIERSATVKTHQSQVAFPGGGSEPADDNDPIKTALRECEEEVGIPSHVIQVIRSYSCVPTLTSGFFVHPVLGEVLPPMNDNFSLNIDPNEVAHAEWVSVISLLKTKKIEFGLPTFLWHGADSKTRKVWGLTAIIFDLIFKP